MLCIITCTTAILKEVYNAGVFLCLLAHLPWSQNIEPVCCCCFAEDIWNINAYCPETLLFITVTHSASDVSLSSLSVLYLIDLQKIMYCRASRNKRHKVYVDGFSKFFWVMRNISKQHESQVNSGEKSSKAFPAQISMLYVVIS